MLWLFNHKRANFWLPNLGFIFHFSASLNEVFHKGEYNCAEKVFLTHFINMQLNFPVLSSFNCVATQKAGFNGLQDAGPAIFTFLGNRTFSEKIVPRNIFTCRLLYCYILCIQTKQKKNG